jgi:hypothetical protein
MSPAGVTWGAKLDTLALTYKTYIRPAMEYGTEIFPAAAAMHSRKIDKVQQPGYGIYCIFFEEATPMSTDACQFNAEAAAIENAARKIAETPIFPLNKDLAS